MFKYFWLIICYSCLLGCWLFSVQTNAAPGQPYEYLISNRSRSALEWEHSYEVGSEYFKAGKYEAAERALSSALEHARAAQNFDNLCTTNDGSKTPIGIMRRERQKNYSVTISRLSEELIAAKRNHNEALEKEALKKCANAIEDAKLPDSRIDKTKRLLAECYKQHAASLQKTMAPIKSIPKEWLFGLSIGCGLIALFSILGIGSGRMFIKVPPRFDIINIVIVIVFGLAYYAFDRLVANLSNID